MRRVFAAAAWMSADPKNAFDVVLPFGRDVRMVAKVYARFKPDAEERDRWERIAAARDAEKWPSKGANGGATSEKLDEVEAASDWDESSRGGTRTRDPGIMRAEPP